MEEVKLSKEKQGKLQTISKIISICSIIGRVFCIIGVVGVVLAMLIVPFITGNIKISESNKTIKIFDEEIKYERDDKTLTFTKDDDTTTIDDKDAVFALNKVFDYLEKNDLTHITILVEATFVLVIATLVVTFMILGKVRKLFNNIHDGDTPFTMDNVEYIKNIAILLIIMAVIKIAGGGIISMLISNTSNFSFSLTDVLYILVLFAASYIFEYGCALQSKTDSKIYE